MINVVKRHNQERDKVEKVMLMVQQSGGIEYAEQRMREYQSSALELLNQFPESETKRSLIQLAQYVISRTK